MLENNDLLTFEQIEQYNDKGYILIKNAIDVNLTKEAVQSYKNMRKKFSKSNWTAEANNLIDKSGID